MLTRFVAILILVLPNAVLAQAERVALVIGNANYASVASLSNPRNDAADIGAALTRLDFDVTRLDDLDARAMNIALRDFSRKADDAEMAIVYFAGHGMEIDNVNYLIPVDAVIERASDVTFEATEMRKFLRAVSGAGTLRLVLLDACRDNPFLRQMADASTRSLGRGLGQVEPTAGVLVAYSARGGTVAYDGDGRNSPYATALLTHLEEPGLEIGQLFRRVRDTVLQSTGGRQEPFTYGSLPASGIYLAAAKPKGPSPTEVLGAFLSADAENTIAAWQSFLDTYRDSGADEAVLTRAEVKLAALVQRKADEERAEIERQKAELERATEELRRAEEERAALERLRAEEERARQEVEERRAALKELEEARKQLEDARRAADKAAQDRDNAAALEQPATLPAPPQSPIQTDIPVARTDTLIRACDRLAADPNDESLPEGSAGIESADINADAAVTACTIAVAGNPDHARSHYNLSRAFEAAGERGKANASRIASAEMGHRAAAISVAVRTLKPGANGENVLRAREYLIREMDGGSAVAARLLGDYHSQFFATLRYPDVDPADYYLIAAERGDILAKHEVGYRLMSASGSSPEERVKGMLYLEEAAEANLEGAALRLANFHLSGSLPGVKKDKKAGITWLEVAAKQGSNSAAMRLARLYKVGKDVRQDPKVAAEWTRIAATRGDTRAKVEHGYNWETGRGQWRANPIIAARNYIEALQARSSWPYRRREAEWDRETAKALQRQLSQLNAARYRGPIDGVVGRGTREAMRRLCKCSRAPATFSFADRF